MEFKYNDGGRSKYFKGTTGDCVTRSIAIATGIDYKEVYDLVNEFAKSEKASKRRRGHSNARTGVHRITYEKVLKSLGWKWKPLMQIGSGCTTHLSADELPEGILIVSLSRHLSVVIDGVLHDIYDCSRNGTRCVYGYYYQ